MNVGIIIGSPRKNSNSAKVAGFVSKTLKDKNIATSVETINLIDNPLNLWDETLWQDQSTLSEQWLPYKEQLKKCSSLVVISPEYHGMAPSCLKNFFLMCDGKVLAHKPGMIVTVSSGEGGAYVVAELRMSSYKNNRLCYIPDHVLIKRADDMMNGAVAKPDSEDAHIRSRLTASLKSLARYDLALKEVRKEDDFDYKAFGNGM